MSRYVEALRELGSTSTLDVNDYSPQTQQSMNSHVKLFQLNNVQLSEEHLSSINIRTVLDGLKNTKGRPLSEGYKRQVGITLQRMYPNIKFKMGKFKRHQKRSKATDINFMSKMEKLVEQAAIMMNLSKDLLSITRYDLSVVILLTTCANLRINEILQLKMEHIDKIRKGLPINIQTKGRVTEPRVVTRSDLLTLVLNNIEARRSEIEHKLETALPSAWIMRQRVLFKSNFIILSSLSNLRKNLIEFGATNGVEMDTYGFNMFRKYTTSILVNEGGHKVAQMLNNHSSVNTTLNHYAIMGEEAAENAIKSIVE